MVLILYSKLITAWCELNDTIVCITTLHNKTCFFSMRCQTLGKIKGFGD